MALVFLDPVIVTIFDEKNPGSGREITPEFATDHPASHTLTHLTQLINNKPAGSDTVYRAGSFPDFGVRWREVA